MGTLAWINSMSELDEIDRRAKVSMLSDSDLLATKQALLLPIFQRPDNWLAVIDEELERRKLTS